MTKGWDFLQFPEGAVAVVTGAGSGIGLATANLLIAEGVAVSGWDIDRGAIEVWSKESSSATKTLALQVDVTDIAAVRAALEVTERELGAVQFLVNNAGPAQSTPVSFVEGLSIAAGSVELVTQAWLETAGAENGHVVNISSVSGSWIGAGSQSWYPAAKAAIAGYTRNLALNRPRGIRANSVAPGMTATPRTIEGMASPEGQGIIERNPFRRAGQPLDVAAAVVFLLAPASTYINGVILPVDGGSLLTQ